MNMKYWVYAVQDIRDNNTHSAFVDKVGRVTLRYGAGTTTESHRFIGDLEEAEALANKLVKNGFPHTHLVPAVKFQCQNLQCRCLDDLPEFNTKKHLSYLHCPECGGRDIKEFPASIPWCQQGGAQSE